MMKTNHLLRIGIFFLLFHIAVLAGPKAYAARLSLSPASAAVTNGQTIQISILINTENTPVFGADAVLSFPGSDIEITGIANGGFFSDLTSASDINGRIEIHGYLSSLYDSRNGSGTLATLMAKAKKGSGSASITFICTGGNTNTQILNSSGNNVLSCGTLNQSTLSFTEVLLTPTPTATPTPTPTPTPTGIQGTVTPSPTPTPTPTGGNAVPNCTGMSVSPNYGGKPLTITLMCFGTDSDGYLNESEFVFGDGTKENVVKNVGSPGYHTTTHTYGSIGSYKASCRVRDNNTVYSHESTRCENIVTVTSESVRTTGVATTKKPTPTTTAETIEPTPTFILLSQYQEPTPTPEKSFTPTEPPKEKISYNFPLPLLFILPGVLLFVVGIYFKMKE